ncbi:MAG TPA: hypothetical protein VEL79_02735 [Vicinamibacterales bacterium]|nr:hypothetical protein [Vicinamibacterales bacterium]
MTLATDLKQRGVLLMIGLTLVTGGLYYPLWFLRRLSALNRLNAPRKLRVWPFLLLLALTLIRLIVFIRSGPPRPHPADALSLLLRLVSLAVGILILVQCFFIKDMLEDHLSGPEGDVSSSIFSESVKLSGLMTFFFGIYYLQHVINENIERLRLLPSGMTS